MTTHSWKANATGSYTDAGNWTDNLSPQPGDTMVVNSGTLTVANTTLANEALTFTTALNPAGDSYTDSIALDSTTIDSASQLTLDGPSPPVNAAGTLTFLNAPVNGLVVNQGRITVGDGKTVTTVNLSQGNLFGDPAGAAFVNKGTIFVSALSGLEFDSAGVTHTIENDGTIQAGNASLLAFGSSLHPDDNASVITNNGLISITSAGNPTNAVIDNALTGHGTIVADGAQASLRLEGSVVDTNVVAKDSAVVGYVDQLGFGGAANTVSGGSFTFAGNAAGLYISPKPTLASTPPNDFTRPLFNVPIYGFTAGDQIQVDESSGYAINSFRYDPNTGNLTLFNMNPQTGQRGADIVGFHLVGKYNQNDFQVTAGDVAKLQGSQYFIKTTNTANAGELPCFVAGTLIMTAHGPVPVEAIAAGDTVVTADGRHAPVRWVGQRTVDCRRHPHPARVRPIRIAAGTFGEGQPCADLLLSPEHAILFGSVLIPVHRLVDGVAIARVAADRVTFHHIELDRHDVLLSNGMPAESYLDTGNRPSLETGAVTPLHPDFCSRAWEGESCLPLRVAGPDVERARAVVALASRRMSLAA